MRVLVCGGRDCDPDKVRGWLDTNDNASWETIIHGGARGADSSAGEWAQDVGLKVEIYRPDWGAHGKAAGPKRNQQMLDEGKPDLVIAFPGGRGTDDMVRRTEKAKIEIIRPII